MTDRYWVGGTANWDGTAGTKWATVSGGAGGAAVPTSSDNVFFDAASGAVTVTVTATANCADLTFTGFTGTFAGTSILNVAGSLTLSAGMTRTFTGSLNFTATTIGKTITSNGISLAGAIAFAGSGGVWTLQDNFTNASGNNIDQQAGTVDLNGKTVSCGTYSLSGATAKTLTFGAGTISLTGNWNYSGSNATINANTGTITGSSSTAVFGGNGATYNNVTLTPSTSGVFISGINTFANLTVNPSNTSLVSFSNDQTITGTLTLTGQNSANRLLAKSNIASARTLTVATVSLTDVEFIDITGAGTASPFTGTRLGDRKRTAGGASTNSGITFTAGTDKFWVGGAGNINDATNHWATSTGGAAGVNNYPLPQDNAKFDASSGGGAVTVNQNFYITDINATGFTGSWASSSTAITTDITGALTLGIGMTATGNNLGGTVTFNAQASKNLTFNGREFGANGTSGSIAFNGTGGTWVLQDAWTQPTNTSGVIVTSGTLDTNGKAVTGRDLTLSGVNATLTLGASTYTVTGTNGFNIASAATVNAGTSNLIMSSTGVSNFTGGSHTFNTVTVNNTPISIVFQDANTYANLTITPTGVSSGVQSISFAANQTVTGTFTATGASIARRPLLAASIPGTAITITAAAVSLTDVNFCDITAAGVASPFTGTRLGDCDGNSNITMTPKTVYWVGNTANWNSASWATSSGGAGATNNMPLPQDTATFDANSFSANSQTLSTTSGDVLAVRNIDFSAINRTGILWSIAAGQIIEIYGNVTLNSTMGTWGLTGSTVRYVGRRTSTWNTNGVAFTTSPAIGNRAIGGVLKQGGNFSQLNSTSAVQIGVSAGTWDMNGFNLTVGGFNTNSSTTRTFVQGTGTLTLQGSQGLDFGGTGLTYTVNKNAYIDLQPDNNPVTINANSKAMANIKITGSGTGVPTISGSTNSWNIFQIDAPRTVKFTPGSNNTVNYWKTNSSLGNVITLDTATGAGTFTLTKATTGPLRLIYHSITRSIASPASTWYASTGSTNGGTNTNWGFTDPPGRYWVGGTGNWDASTTTNWASTSGGTGGSSVPTSTDDVFFDENSGTGTVTVTVGTANCASINFTRYGGTFSGNGVFVSLRGSLTLYSGMTNSFIASWLFSATATGRGIFTDGKNLTSGEFNFNNSSGGWTLLDGATFTGGFFTVGAGTIDTNDQAITVGSLSSSGSTARTLTLGNSAITLTGASPISFSGSNFTFNANTSTITCTATAAKTIATNGLTFATLVNQGGGSNVTDNITGAATFANLNVTTTGSFNNFVTQIDSNITVSTLFTLTGFNSSSRVLFRSSAPGTARTVTAASVALTDCEFTDITGAGAASPFTGTRIGDRRPSSGGVSGNSGITFTAGTDKFWVAGTGNTSDATNHWATSTGGAAGVNNYPLPQDNAKFDGSSGGGNVTFNNPFQITDLIGTGYTGTWTGSNVTDIAGNFTIGAGMAAGHSVGNTVTFNATSTGKTLTFNGKQFNVASTLSFDGTGGGWSWADTANFGTSGLFLLRGTLNFNNLNTTAGTFASSNSNTRTLTMGSGTITLSGNSTAWNTDTTTGLTFNANTSTIALTSTGLPFFIGGGLTFNNLTAAALQVTFISGSGNNTFNNFTVNGGSSYPGTSAFFRKGTTNTISGTLTFAGNSASSRLFVAACTNDGNTIDATGTATISAAAVSGFTDVDFQNITATGAATPWTGTRLGDCTGNTSITFGAGVNKYWVGNTGNWNSTSWATTSGGAAAANNYPLPQDTCIFDGNSFSANSQAVTINGNGARVPALDFTAVPETGITLTYFGSPVRHYGSLTLISTMATSGAFIASFTGSGTSTLTTAGVSFSAQLTIDKGTGTLTHADNFTSSLPQANGITFIMTSGTWNLNGKTITGSTFLSTVDSAFSTGTINANGGNITLSGNAATVWSQNTPNSGFTLGQALPVNLTYSGATGTRTLANASTGANAPNFNITAGTDIITNNTSASFGSMDFTGFAGTWTLTSFTLYGSLTVSTGMTVSSTASTLTFGATSGTQTITTNGKTFDFFITQNGAGGTVQFADNLTMGSTRFFTLTAGTLNLNTKTLTTRNFSSNNSNTRVIAGGTGSIIVVTGNALTPVDFTTATNLTFTGTITFDSNYSGATGTRTFTGGGTQSGADTVTYKISAGTDIINFSGTMPNIDFTGFSGTYNPVNGIGCVGNWTFSSGMTVSAGTLTHTFNATSGTKTITSNGKTWDFPITISGVGGTFKPADAMTVGTSRTFTLGNGVWDLNGQVLTTGLFSSSNSNTRTIKSTVAGGKIVTSGTGTSTVWDTATTTNITIDRTGNNWSIEIGGNTTNVRTFSGGGLTFPTIIFTNTTAAGGLTFSGNNTFKSIAYTGGTAQTLRFSSGTTTTVEDANGFPSGTSGNVITLDTATGTGTFTLAKTGGGKVACNFLSISRSTATPNTPNWTWYAGANSTNVTTNVGWAFRAVPTYDFAAFNMETFV